MISSRLSFAGPALVLFAAAGFAADEITAEAILDKYIEVTGGRAAYEKIHSEIATGTLEITGAGISGTLTIYRLAPDKGYTLIDLAGFGKVEEGSDGQVAWSVNPMQGAHIKEGDERAQALRSGALHAEARWREFYKKAELAGTEDVDGKPCYKVTLAPNEGGAETYYYDKATNLLVKMVMPVTAQQGPATAEISLGDYREEGGIRVPHTIKQKVPGAEVLMKITEVKENPDIPASRFDLPAEIKALLPADKDKGKAEKK